jgi:hypothetical protein
MYGSIFEHSFWYCDLVEQLYEVLERFAGVDIHQGTIDGSGGGLQSGTIDKAGGDLVGDCGGL